MTAAAAPRLRRLAGNTVTTIIVRGLSSLPRLAMIVVGRTLLPVDFGRITLVLVFLEVFRVIGDAGISLVAIRRFARDETSIGLMPAILAINLAFAPLALLLAICTFRIVYGQVDPLFALLWPILPAQLLLASFASAFQARLRMQYALAGSLAGALITGLIIAIALSRHSGVNLLAIAFAAGSITELATTASVFRATSGGLSARWDREWVSKLLRESWPVLLGGTLVVWYLRADAVYLSRLADTASAGQYAAAMRLTEPFSLIATSLGFGVYATLSAALPPQRRRAERTALGAVIPRVIGTFIIIAVVLSAFARQITGGIFGNNYQAAAQVLMLLAWLIPLRGLNALLTATINARGVYVFVTMVAAMNLTTNLTLNLLLVPKLHLIGTAIAAVCAEALGSAAQAIYLLRPPKPTVV